MNEMKILEINLENETIIERLLTVAELEQKEIDAKMMQERQKENQEKLDAKAALLARLGITEDEAKLLLS